MTDADGHAARRHGKPPRVLSAAWRQPVVLQGFTSAKQGTCGLPTWGLPKAEWVPGAELFVVRDDGRRGVLSCAGDSRRTSLLSFMEHSETPLREHRQLAAVRVGQPVTSLLWSTSDALLLGGPEGTVRLYQVPEAADADAIAATLTSPPTATYQPAKMKETRNVSVSPSKWTFSSWVVRVVMAASKRRFVSVENARLHVWDMETGGAGRPVRASAGNILDASCSPTADHIIATGSATGGAKVIDTRGKSEQVWQVNNAHGDVGVVRRVSLSPLVDHWLATATDGGDIRIWDTRMNGTGADGVASVLEFNHYQCLLTGLAWSPLHADLLASSGMDGSMRVYSLNHAPSYAVATAGNASPTVGLGFTACPGHEPQSCVSIASTSGEISSYAISPIFMESVFTPRFRDLPSHDVALNDLAADSERLARLRHMKDATYKVRKAVEKAMARNDTALGMELMELLHRHEPAALPEDADHATAVAAFRHDLAESITKLPPLYPFAPSQMLAHLEANLTYEHLYDRGDWAGLTAAVDARVERFGLERAMVALQAAAYAKVVKGLARHAWAKGCVFFLETEGLVRDLVEAHDAEALVDHLLGGDILDASTGSPPPGGGRTLSARATSLSPCAPPWPTELIAELRRLRAATDLLPSPRPAGKLVALVEDHRDVAGVVAARSGALLRLYCTALMQAAEHAKIVWAADWLAAAHPDTDVAKFYQSTVQAVLGGHAATLEKAKGAQAPRRGGGGGVVPQGKQLVDALGSTLQASVALAVMVREVMYISARHHTVHVPPAGGPLTRAAKFCLKHGDDARGAAALLLRQADGADSAVRHECDAARVAAGGELRAAIAATQWARDEAGAHAQLARQAAALSESLAKLLEQT